uniref:Uncharacterized protein n=1 Tax=Romanomermis culicivorax TaxID=13658 RepID=A0A915KZ79_ROMCU
MMALNKYAEKCGKNQQSPNFRRFWSTNGFWEVVCSSTNETSTKKTLVNIERKQIEYTND